MTEDQWLVVLNPVSGRGRGLRERARIERLMRERAMAHVVAVSEYHGHAIALVEEAVTAGCRRVLVAGGDGSLNEAANGILRQRALASDAVTLAVLPVGTGNDWARGRGVPRAWEAALDLAASGASARHDAGMARFAAGEPRGFVNVAGLGFDAAVIERMPDRRFGTAAYVLGLLRSLAGYRNVRIRISCDDAPIEEHDAFVLFALIGSHCGGGMHMAPEALIDDGVFDLTLVQSLSRLAVLANLRRLFDGSLAAHPRVRMRRAGSLRVEAAAPVGVEVDGELVGHTPVRFDMLAGALRMVMPPGRSASA